nr:hypothetical protein [Bacteroidota bacterium]
MQISNDFHTVDFDSIPIDSFWKTGDERENKMHRIHAYPAKFPAFITTKALEYATLKGAKINVIADTFCGCGTVAYEATRNGKDFWGCDINPVATLIAEAKSQKYSNEKLNKYFLEILSNFDLLAIARTEIENINERIKHWFREEQIENLLKLKSAIHKTIPSKSHYLKFFLCAFSNILKPTSVWLTKSIKPQVDPNKKHVDVITAFSEQFKKNLFKKKYNF